MPFPAQRNRTASLRHRIADKLTDADLAAAIRDLAGKRAATPLYPAEPHVLDMWDDNELDLIPKTYPPLPHVGPKK